MAGHSGPFSVGVSYDQAVRWLKAIGGTGEILLEPDGRETVLVTVDGAIKGKVTWRVSFDGGFGPWAREIEYRKAFASACDAVKAALD